MEDCHIFFASTLHKSSGRNFSSATIFVFKTQFQSNKWILKIGSQQNPLIKDKKKESISILKCPVSDPFRKRSKLQHLRNKKLTVLRTHLHIYSGCWSPYSYQLTASIYKTIVEHLFRWPQHCKIAHEQSYALQYPMRLSLPWLFSLSSTASLNIRQRPRSRSILWAGDSSTWWLLHNHPKEFWDHVCKHYSHVHSSRTTWNACLQVFFLAPQCSSIHAAYTVVQQQRTIICVMLAGFFNHGPLTS